MSFDLTQYGITGESTNHTLVGYHIHRNPSVAKLYALAVRQERYNLANNGALMAFSAPTTGRSPKDTRIVEEERTGLSSVEIVEAIAREEVVVRELDVAGCEGVT